MSRTTAATARPAGGCLLLDSGVRVPFDVRDLESFRRWACSGDFPEKGRIDFIGGVVEIDMSAEDMGTHGDPKVAIAVALGSEVRDRKLGRVWFEKARLSNAPADLSCESDVIFFRWETLESGRAKLIPKATREEGRFVEVEGAADLVVEVLSDSSERKDADRLRAAYHAAGVAEYWLVDARRDPILFVVLVREARDYAVSPRDGDGFARSAVLGRRVRLARVPARLGLHDYTLELRALPSSRAQRRRSTPS